MGVYQIGKMPQFHDMMQSVLQQSYRNFEFIICDDGSTDETLTVLEKYSKKDDRIRILQNEVNLGLAASLNKCISVVQGAFVARQDADDLSDIKRIETQIQFLNKNLDIHFVGSNVSLYSDGEVWGQRNLPEFPENKDFLFTSPFVHGSVVFRTEVLKSVGGYRITKDTVRAEDYDLFMNLYASRYNGSNIQKNLYIYCEDIKNMKKRIYKERISEAKIRAYGFSRMGLMPKGYLYVIKPLVVGLIPSKLLLKFKIVTKKMMLVETGYGD